MKFKPMVVLPPLTFAALALVFFFGMQRDNPDALPSTREGGLAPALTLTELTGGEPFTDADLASGHVILVNFWASWCAPCRAEHPQLTKMAQDGIEIYGINYKDNSAKALDFLDEMGNPFARLAADASGRTGLDWGIYGVPETFIIDGNGLVVKRFAGPISDSVLAKVIRPAIAEAESHTH